MKSTILCALISTAACFGLFARADACGPSGSQPVTCHTSPYSPSPYPYPPTASSPFTQAGPVNSNLSSPVTPFRPVNSNLSSPVTSSVPKSHLTVLPTTSNDAAGNVPVAAPVPSATIRQVFNTETVDITKTTPKIDAEATKAADVTAAAKVESSKIADAIKGLVGTWMAVARHNGELTTVELQLDDRGWAKLTVPGADGKPSTTTRKVEFENDELKLTGSGAADLSLGKLVEFDSRQMVLDRAGGQVTFVRP